MILSIAQIVVSILLIASILMQRRGSGLSGAFGGAGSVYYQKRGAEKLLFNLTIVLSGLFIGLAVINLLK
ncbi:MAG: preprotein translocase subunit SecG [Candidatus Spechtbacteria bacterium RIFCSPHIGHO2_02_FULL_43_15b]|uniref:Protein-export membrane protein SecG n=1 Tax=Candidatus Spechtbacteria bacterium RIFCSPHIGHO2_01_FULL_43_30 TaxID=1802158 RepID=A0A1G2H7R7_9BACT|nr:MAG: preprotein translocase subunit SecG [Candidatus Spechtbacteria bacterium RIFCSPHIGHO2_01_FULL_43_30]OGZ60444.1 MAG: preprotein translocase subunit SecG [Candidatus Spechtbacteria bacterium RIFCSPHIGHO2_02_FULL_43_15b]